MSALTRLETGAAVDRARQVRTESTAAAGRLSDTLTQAGQHTARLDRAVKEARR
ncbi:hypothetical protein [Streptacidiphilus neutrinimicus]|uniref:hypothetical protein n=1 Tax=Streptacidiphilus neutrinimicus TaxID=105420 RepID=UPI0013779957|nr:hypothetical protein [Streptacidiphilus neutrinimicus]